MQCEVFAGTDPVPGLNADEVSAYFAKMRQLLDLLTSEAWSNYLSDYGKDDNRYNLVQPKDIIVVMDKVHKADKKNLFSVLSRTERDKKLLWESVYKQLKLLADCPKTTK